MQMLEGIDFKTAVLLAAAAGVLVLGLLAATRREAAFEAADRNVPAIISGMAMSAAFLSAAPFVGLVGTLFVVGSDGLCWLVGLAAGFVLMGVLIAPSFRASEALSVPEFLERRFGGRLLPLLGSFVVIGCCFVLLVSQLAVIGAISVRALGVPAELAVGSAAVVAATTLAAGGMRSAMWLGALLLAAVLVAYLTPLAVMGMAKHGIPIGPLAYGQTLQELQKLEINMISSGLADARSLKPHLRPFLQIDRVNTVALIVCLIAGTAVLPHVLMRSAVTAGVRQTRMSMAWALLFTVTVLSAIPAYAAMTKHDIYSFIAKGVPFAELPPIFGREDVSVHGVPFSLYEAVADAKLDSGTDTETARHKLKSDDAYAAWADLKPQVKAALVEAAKGSAEANSEQRFDTWRATVLPVAAVAAGNKTGKLTQGAIAIEPGNAVFLGFALSGLSRGWIVLFAVGGILAAFATSVAAMWAIAMAIGRDLAGTGLAGTRTSRTGTTAVRISIVGLTAVAALAALRGPPDIPQVAAWTFSAAAAGLFPVLVMGIWWKRTTRAGAIAGLLAGLSVTLFYIAGSQLAPVTFFQATGVLSDGGTVASKKSADLSAAAEKASVEAKPAAEAALTTYLRGTAYKAGGGQLVRYPQRSGRRVRLAVGILSHNSGKSVHAAIERGRTVRRGLAPASQASTVGQLGTITQSCL